MSLGFPSREECNLPWSLGNVPTIAHDHSLYGHGSLVSSTYGLFVSLLSPKGLFKPCIWQLGLMTPVSEVFIHLISDTSKCTVWLLRTRLFCVFHLFTIFIVCLHLNDNYSCTLGFAHTTGIYVYDYFYMYHCLYVPRGFFQLAFCIMVI